MLIRHADFSFLFHEREADFETKGIFEQGGRTLDDLVMLLRAMANLASGEGAIVMSGDDGRFGPIKLPMRSEEHTSELQSLMRISYAVFCLKNKNPKK